MTDEEKDELRKTKDVVSNQLAKIPIRDYRLDEIDSRLIIYTSAVCNDPEGHNLYEQLAVKRFFHMVAKYGVNISEVRKFFTLYEYLYFPGAKGLTRYKLTPVQAFQFTNIYGFWNNNRRVVKEACLFVPRKFSKTTSCAAPIIYDLLYGDANAECYTGANSSDQAKKCFNVIRDCFRKLDPRQRRYIVNEQMIKSNRPDRTALAQCLTANANTKDGLNASTVVMDEFSQARDSGLLNVLTTSMGTRTNPLTIIITTASDVFTGPFYTRLQGYRDLLLGRYNDDSIFAHLFEPDVDDPEDTEATWHKVNPHIGVTVQEDFYPTEYEKALRNGAKEMLDFRTKLLNVYAENDQKCWISGTLARKASWNLNWALIMGRPDAMVAIDLSVSGDFSAVTFGMYKKETTSFYFYTKYFFPEGALKGHPNEKLYRAWAADKHLCLTKGDVVDYEEIVGYILKLNGKVRILQIGYDPWKAKDVVNMLAASGAKNVLKSIRQTYGYFTAPVESFEHGIKTGHIFVDDNPINAYCFGNAVLDFDRLDNCKPIKRTENRKIDGVITMLMAMKLFSDYHRVA